ncbi:MAG: hypothetical protein AB7V13_07855 [Pseudorhodoplanes sp.]
MKKMAHPGANAVAMARRYDIAQETAIIAADYIDNPARIHPVS